MNFSFDQFSYHLRQLGDWGNLLDISIVTLIIFGSLRLIRGTRAIQVLRGFLLVAVVLTGMFSMTTLELPATSWLIEKTLPSMFLVVPVIFQPELRRALEQLGEASRYLPFLHRNQSDPTIDAVVTAAHKLSQRRHGALIVFEQETGLQEYVDTGVGINAQLSPELLLTIFNKHTELHDGAIIIRKERLAAAACVMPLSTGNLSDRQMGLRHRAGLGISEVSDAVSLLVSEETGQFAITHNGRILRRQDPEKLDTILQAFLQKKQPGKGNE